MLSEDSTAGDGGSFGGGDSFGHGGAFGNTDFWGAGRGMMPIPLGAKKVRSKKKRSSKRKKRKSKKNKKLLKAGNQFTSVLSRKFPELLFGPTGIGGKRGYGRL